jgi:hypothetical protein
MDPLRQINFCPILAHFTVNFSFFIMHWKKRKFTPMWELFEIRLFDRVLSVDSALINIKLLYTILRPIQYTILLFTLKDNECK